MDLPPQSRLVAIPCLLGVVLFVLSRISPEPVLTAVLSVAGIACLLAGLWFTRDLLRRLQAQATELKDKQKA